MDLSRLRRLVRARWWIVAFMALLGLGAALAFTNYTNNNVEPRFKSIATLEFVVVVEGEESGGGGGGRSGGNAPSPAAPLVEEAIDAALEVNADLLEQNDPNVAIESDPDAGTLIFAAFAPSAETSEGIALEMRDNYVAIDPTAIDVEALKADLVAQAAQIQERITELSPPPAPAVPPVPPEVQAQMDVLNGQIASVTNEVGLIQEAITFETDEDVIAEHQESLEAVTARLAELKAALAEITPPVPVEPTIELTPAEELEKSALEAQLETITLEYQELLAMEESDAERLILAEVVTTDETPAPTTPALAALIGFLGGAVAGLVAIVIVDRLQGAVWVAKDMEQMPLLAEVPQHAGTFGLRKERHEHVRQKGVQSIRSAVLGLYHAAGPTTIGFTGLGSADESVSELVLEVAHSLAGVGRSVLLVDGQIGGLPAFRNQLAGGSNLADLVAHDADTAALKGDVAAVLEDCVEIAPNLSVLPGDPRTVDPVDVLASKAFRELTGQASTRYDIVMVVGPSALSPFAYVMAGLVAAYVVVTTVGRTRQAHIEQLAKQFAGSPGRLVGAVLLGVKPRRGWVPASDLGRGPAAAPEPEKAGVGASAGTDDNGDYGILERLGQSLAALAGDKNDDQ